MIILFVTIGSYLFLAYALNYPPFCSGYPLGGDCSGNYSYTFTLSINYTGPWRATYYGYREVGASGFTLNGSFIGKNFNGTGAYTTYITLSGPNNQGLELCVQAEKLDSSNKTLTIDIGYTNSTSLPFGSTYICTGVVP